MRVHEKRKKILSRVLIVETIICYMTILAVISHVRGPVQYQVLASAPLLTAADFTAVNYMGSYEISGDVIHIENDNAGAPAVYAAELELSGLGRIQVGFTVECQEAYAGNLLHIDLCGENYDNDAQEYQVVLVPGTNELSFVLEPGEDAPETAKFRIFTLDAADFEIQNLQIAQAVPQPKVTAAMGITTAVFVCILAGTVILRLICGESAEPAADDTQIRDEK